MKQEEQAPRSYLVHWIITAGLIGAVIAFVALYQPAKELAWQAFRVFFSLVSTPFILEFSVGLLGVVFLVYYNGKRRAKEQKDEWVLMEVDEEEEVSKETSEEHSANSPNS